MISFVFMFISVSDIKIKLMILIISLVIIIILSIILNIIKSKKITLNVSNNTKMNIYYGDIFSETGNIVIPVSEYFDMTVDEIYVSSKTLHGQFVNKIFGSNINELEEKIKEKLSNVKGFSDKKRNKTKYPVGTTITIEKNNNRYFLVVLSKLSSENKAYCNVEDYYLVIQKLLYSLHNYSQGEKIFLPLIGGGLSNVDMSKNDLINSLIISIKANKKFSAIGDINLVLNKNLSDEINLSDIKYYHK